MSFILNICVKLNRVFILEKTLPIIGNYLDFFLANKIEQEILIGDDYA